MQLLFNELHTIYHAISNGLDVPLQPLRIQYKDFSAYQRTRLDSNQAQSLRQYWHNALRAPMETLRLPTFRNRPDLQTFTGASHIHQFSRSTYQNLLTVANKHEASLFMTLVALVDVLFYRYSG
ncbi:MAG: condensation domain-containing protein, partial [Flammeovirgaceae bacterium]